MLAKSKVSSAPRSEASSWAFSRSSRCVRNRDRPIRCSQSTALGPKVRKATPSPRRDVGTGLCSTSRRDRAAVKYYFTLCRRYRSDVCCRPVDRHPYSGPMVGEPLAGPAPESGVTALGPRVREERQRAGLSLRGLARTIGVSASMLSQIETGKTRPSVNTLYAITSALGISIEEVFSAAVPPFPDPTGPDATAPDRHPRLSLGDGV